MSLWGIFGFVLLIISVLLLPQFIIWCSFGSTYGSRRCLRRIPRLIVVLATIGTLTGTAGHYLDIQSRTRITKVPPAGNEQALRQQVKSDLTVAWRRLGIATALEIVAIGGCIAGATTGIYSMAYRACGVTPFFAAVIVAGIWEINDLKYQMHKLGD